jgi:hypothetical protein
MKHAAVVLALSFVIFVAPAVVRADDPSVPLYLNGQIVRVGHDAVTIREGGRDTTLAVDAGLSAQLASFHPGDRVIVTCRTVDQGRVVTGIRASSESTAGAGPIIVRPARVVSIDGNTKTITIVDPDGKTRAFPVHGAALVTLPTVNTGDSVSLTLEPLTGPDRRGRAALSGPAEPLGSDAGADGECGSSAGGSRTDALEPRGSGGHGGPGRGGVPDLGPRSRLEGQRDGSGLAGIPGRGVPHGAGADHRVHGARLVPPLHGFRADPGFGRLPKEL